MEIVNIEARTFEAMLSKFEVFADRMEKLCTFYGDMSQRTWLDNQDVCLMLNISPRTLQTLRGVIYIIRLSGIVFLWHSRQIIASLNLYASWVSMRNASAIIICSEYISMLLPFGRVIYRSDPYSLTIPLLYMAMILLLNVGVVTPNNSTNSCVLIHISSALAFGKCTRPCSSIVIIARFILFIILRYKYSSPYSPILQTTQPYPD